MSDNAHSLHAVTYTDKAADGSDGVRPTLPHSKLVQSFSVGYDGGKVVVEEGMGTLMFEEHMLSPWQPHSKLNAKGCMAQCPLQFYDIGNHE